jgi:hypothetical protein
MRVRLVRRLIVVLGVAGLAVAGLGAPALALDATDHDDVGGISSACFLTPQRS